MISEIHITCDDTRHARGKRAKIQTFTHSSEFGWQLGLPDDHIDSADRPVDFERAGHLRHARASLRGRHTLGCKLCGLSVTLRAETLKTILTQLSRGGVSSLRLADLADIVSNQR